MLADAVDMLGDGIVYALIGRGPRWDAIFECPRNDVAANLGVLIAGAAVGVTGYGWPDVLIASIIAFSFFALR